MKHLLYGLSLFKIRRGERWDALLALLYVTILNGMVIARYIREFTSLTDNYHRLFVSRFHVSGFDPLTYAAVSSWYTEYNIYRHPLLAFFMFIPYSFNRLIMWLTGHNGVQFVVALLLIAASFYAFLFLYRIFHEVLSLPRRDARLLCWLTYSFAFVMLASCVPDHFVLSMFLLVFTLYVSGVKLKAHRCFTRWQSVLLFFLTAGVSLNNGIKVLLASWMVNGKRFWRPLNLLLVVVLPCAVIWGIARAEWHYYELPRYKARQELKLKKKQQSEARLAKAFRDTTQLKDTAKIRQAITRLIALKERERQEKENKKAWRANVGKPMAQGEFAQWTDISTPRLPSMIENLFGESIQLHQDHLLEDNLSTRPVIVHYRFLINYVVEGIIVLLFLCGVWYGRKHRLLWLAMSFMGFDLFIHVILGFGLNEVYIMSPHWLFVLTIAMAYLLRAFQQTKRLLPLRLLLMFVTVFLMVWNWTWFISYLF